MKPEAKRRVYWTNVSTNTKVWIGPIGNEQRVFHPTCPQYRGIANTIVQLQSQNAVRNNWSRVCRRLPITEISNIWECSNNSDRQSAVITKIPLSWVHYEMF